MDMVTNILRCSIGRFPIKYLGLPLTICRQSAAQLQGLVDHIAASLPTWRASALPKSGRLLLVKSVLSAMPIHAMLAFELPAKTIKAINKIIRGFLWCGKAEANGGNCAVAWPAVCTPMWAGGLGVPDIQWMNTAMQVRWPWLARTDNSRPWSEFMMPIPKEATQLCNAAMHTTIGDGRDALFWEDRCKCI